MGARPLFAVILAIWSAPARVIAQCDESWLAYINPTPYAELIDCIVKKRKTADLSIAGKEVQITTDC